MNPARLISELTESLRIAMDQLRAHKVRSMLTALGVIIGIVAVTLMGTAIKGIDRGFTNSLDMLGQDVFFLEKWPWRDVGDDWVLYRNLPNIDLRDAQRINDHIARNPDSRLRLAVPVTNSRRGIRHEDRHAPGIAVMGTGSDYALVQTADLLAGRFFTQAEELSRQNVIILGYDVANTLFPDNPESAVGASVSMARMRWRVIGVLDRQGSFLGMQSFDQQVVAPLPAVRKFHSSNRWNSIRVQIAPGADAELALDELTAVYRVLRQLDAFADNDFEINRSEAIEEQLGPIKAGIAIAGFFITGLALFVGAIGIMNITFVSVKERTREIGTRRAIGARRSAILLQFLIEAVSICLLGGIIGVAIAFGLQQAVAAAAPDFPFVFSADLVLIACALSILTGIFSGLAPAWQAARLDPAIALRHE
jgi:putative ABC transport system permease protein